MLTSNFDEVFRIESFAGLLTCLCEQTFILGVYGAFLTRRTLWKLIFKKKIVQFHFMLVCL